MNKSPYLKYVSSLYNVLPRRVQQAFIRTDFVGSVHYVPDGSVSWDLPMGDDVPCSDTAVQTPDHILHTTCYTPNAYLYILTAIMFSFTFPLPQFLCGLIIGAVGMFSLALLVLTFAGEVIVDDIEAAYFKEKMARRHSSRAKPPPTNSPLAHCPPLQEWMSLQTSENKTRTAVLAEFCDNLLVISYPRLNVDPRSVKMDVRTAEFIQRRKVFVTDATVYLLPSTLTLRKLWSKKHPICLDTSPGPLFYLFFSSQRSKEMWYRRLCSATPSGAVVFPPIPSVSAILSQSICQSGLPHYSSDDVKDEQEAAQRLADFMLFMGAAPSQTHSRKDGAAEWLNMLTRRLFYHICTTNAWEERICRRIEHKFKNMDLPSIIDGIDVKSVEIGCNFPEIVRLHKPRFDSMGLWLDLSLVYGGGFRIQLQTYANLFKLTEAAPSSEEYDKGVHRLLNRVRSSSYFKRALELRLVKNSMENIANTPLLLDVEVTGLEGTMTINLPNPPTDRLWFGFKGTPSLHLLVKPKVGELNINELLCKIVKKMLLTEFEREAVFPNMVDIITPLFVSPRVQVGTI